MGKVVDSISQARKPIARLAVTIPLAVLIILFIWLGLRGFTSLDKGFSWEEMDWNQNGSTSMQEFFLSSDIGKRRAELNGKTCVEYYWFKDGMPIKIVCPTESS